MAIDTATIETLTAEVRVLMVGSRQVTLSVAKQLDEIPYSKLLPFGRIRLDHVLAIGRDADSGVLCRAELPRHPGSAVWVDLEDARIDICPSLRPINGTFHLKWNDGRGLLIMENQTHPLACGHNGFDKSCGWASNPAANDRIIAEIAIHEQMVAEHESAKQLPIIVLAGLK